MTPRSSQTEAEVCQNHITPAIAAAGWDPLTQIRREYSFTAGQVRVRGKLATRGDRKRADYLLFYQSHLPLAVVEAKDSSHSVGAGLPQALGYASTLDVPFVFASNGQGFVFHDRTGASQPVEVQLTLDQFPSPAELWARYRSAKQLTPEAESLVTEPYHEDSGAKEPRYYQRIAIQRSLEAVAAGKRRIRLSSWPPARRPTRPSRSWRLWKAKQVKRILFLVDRDILASQTKRATSVPSPGAAVARGQPHDGPTPRGPVALYQAIAVRRTKAFQEAQPRLFRPRRHRRVPPRQRAATTARGARSSTTSSPPSTSASPPSKGRRSFPPAPTSATRSSPTHIQARASPTASSPWVAASTSTRDLEAGFRRPARDQHGELARTASSTSATLERTSSKSTSSAVAGSHRRHLRLTTLRQDHRVLRGHRPRRTHALPHWSIP
ncbi:MAG: type I restriction endonuclease [Myxococcota bacterium]